MQSDKNKFLTALPTEWYSSVLVTTGKRRSQGKTQSRRGLSLQTLYPTPSSKPTWKLWEMAFLFMDSSFCLSHTCLPNGGAQIYLRRLPGTDKS